MLDDYGSIMGSKMSLVLSMARCRFYNTPRKKKVINNTQHTIVVQIFSPSPLLRKRATHMCQIPSIEHAAWCTSQCLCANQVGQVWWIVRPRRTTRRGSNGCPLGRDFVRTHTLGCSIVPTPWRQRKNNKLDLKELGFGERQKKSYNGKRLYF